MKALVIGLDSAPFELVFNDEKIPAKNLRKLAQSSWFGELESVKPPITVPAWACTFTGLDPGQLGIYGFRNLKTWKLWDWEFPTPLMIRNGIWDKTKSIVIGVPPGYPPKRIDGVWISCFMTPPGRPYVYPENLLDEIKKLVGDYPHDVENFRSDEKDRIWKECFEMTKKHFEVLRYLLKTRDWKFAAMVEISLDRIHHAFWNYYDPEHILYEKHPVFSNVIPDYYALLDEEVGRTLEILDDKTYVIVMSDHGAQKLDGGLCINDWLKREGYLSLKREPEGRETPEQVGVEWSKTVAVGEGGYYCRIFINLKGRNPEGIVAPSEYEGLRDELKKKLEDMRGEGERLLGNKVFRPEEIYKEVKGNPPDLLAFFGEMRLRSIGRFGFDSLLIRENDTGPDGANHSFQGMYLISGPDIRHDEKNLSIMDIAEIIRG